MQTLKEKLKSEDRRAAYNRLQTVVCHYSSFNSSDPMNVDDFINEMNKYITANGGDRLYEPLDAGVVNLSDAQKAAIRVIWKDSENVINTDDLYRITRDYIAKGIEPKTKVLENQSYLMHPCDDVYNDEDGEFEGIDPESDEYKAKIDKRFKDRLRSLYKRGVRVLKWKAEDYVMCDKFVFDIEVLEKEF